MLDKQDDRHEKCRLMLSALMSDKSAKEAHDALSSAVSKDTATHDDICIGFMIAILTAGPPGSPEATEIASRYYRDLMLVARDGLQSVYKHMADLALDRYPKLVMGARQQLLWLTRLMHTITFTVNARKPYFSGFWTLKNVRFLDILKLA